MKFTQTASYRYNRSFQDGSFTQFRVFIFTNTSTEVDKFAQCDNLQMSLPEARKYISKKIKEGYKLA